MPRICILAAIALLSGCAASTNVTVLPDPQTGDVGAIELLGPDGESEPVRIDTAGGQARLEKGRPKLQQLSEGRQAALAASLVIPARPATYTLYFSENATELVGESAQLVPQILAEVSARPGANVEVVGHTDTIGSDEDNDRISLQRAQQMVQLLVSQSGLNRSIVRATGRGERGLAVATPDETREPRNNRIYVIIY